MSLARPPTSRQGSTMHQMVPLGSPSWNLALDVETNIYFLPINSDFSVFLINKEFFHIFINIKIV